MRPTRAGVGRKARTCSREDGSGGSEDDDVDGWLERELAEAEAEEQAKQAKRANKAGGAMARPTARLASPA